MTDGRGTEAVIRAYLEALNRADVGAAIACVAADFINEHTAQLGESVRGREAYRTRLSAFLNEFRQLHYEIEELLVDAERAAVAYRLSALWIGTDPTRPRALPFTIRGMFRFRIEAGLIAHRVDYFDSAEFTRQVGAGR